MSDKIWLKQYPPGIPAEVDVYAYNSLVELFMRSCAKFHDHWALENFGSQMRFSELEALSRDFAAYLQKKLQLKKGDKLAIMLPNTMQYYVVLFAALRAGLIVVNVNPLYTANELTHQLIDSGATTVVVLSNFAHTVQEALPKTLLKNIIITDLGDLLGKVKSVVYNFVVRYVKRSIKPYSFPQSILFKTAILEGKALAFETPELGLNDVAFLQYTGGTTGVSKGAILTHGNMVANVEQSSPWLNAVPLRDGCEVVVVPLPLYHIFSLTACAFCFLKIGAQAILITNPRDLKYFIRHIKKIPYTVIAGINTLFRALLQNTEFRRSSFDKLRLVIAGGMPLERGVAEEWYSVTGSRILEGYGLTEASPVVTSNPVNLDHYSGSIGLPIPSTNVAIRDEQGRDLRVNEVGEICVQGPQVMQGYWNNPAETQNVFYPDGWLKTGDIGYYDAKGFFYLLDRKKDMVLVSGFNVYPTEIETVLNAHPGILESAVTSVPDAETGEAVQAYIVKRNPDLTAKEIIAYCRENLTGYKIPKHIEFLPELPKSSVGKVLRRALNHNGEK